MTRNEAMRKLNEIFVEVFDDNSIHLQESTTALDIEDWDSLAQITLVSTIEEHFGVELTLAEVNKLQNVGEFLDCILSKLP